VGCSRSTGKTVMSTKERLGGWAEASHCEGEEARSSGPCRHNQKPDDAC
jgi:hypothetical protein